MRLESDGWDNKGMGLKINKTGGANFPSSWILEPLNIQGIPYPRLLVTQLTLFCPRILQPGHIQVHETAVVNVVGLKGFPDVEQMGAVPW